MSSTNAQTSFAAYQESKRRLEAGRGDARDEALVAVWKTSTEFYAAKAKAEHELQKARRQIRDLAYVNDCLESRLHLMTGNSIELTH